MNQSKSLNEVNTALQTLLMEEKYAEALPMALQLLSMARAHFADDPLTIATAMSNVGFVYMQLAEYDLGQRFLTQAMDLRKEHAGPDSVELAISLLSMARCFLACRDPRDALPLFEQALAIFRQRLGELDPQTNRYQTEYEAACTFVARLKPGEQVNMVTPAQARAQLLRKYRF